MAAGLIEQDGRLLLVRNVRRDGSSDWTTPGGVVDPGEELLDALTREVAEETGLAVTGWEGPVWRVHAEAPDMGWVLQVEVHRAVGFTGSIELEDPDGIVVEAAWLHGDDLHRCVSTAWVPAREPMLAWLTDPWDGDRHFRYLVEGLSRADAAVSRLG